MCLNKMIFYSLFFGLVALSDPLHAELNFEQEVTITSFKSEEDSKDMANQFLQAAEGDQDLKVIEVKYKQNKLGEDFIGYDAIIKCHVSKPDDDVFRIQAKMIESNINANRNK